MVYLVIKSKNIKQKSLFIYLVQILSLHVTYVEAGKHVGSCFGFRVPVCGFWLPVICM